MRRPVIILAAILLVTTLVSDAALAGKKKRKKPVPPRTIELTYSEPTPGVGGVGGLCVGGGCPDFPVLEGEAYVKFEIVDASGLPAFGQITQDTNGDSSNERIGSFCGETEEAVPFTPGFSVRVFVYAVGATPPCAAPASSGKIIATFSAIP